MRLANGFVGPKWARAWLVVWVLVAGQVDAAARQRDALPATGALSIYIHNFAEMDNATLEAAAQDAEDIFRQAGIPVRVNLDRMVMQGGELKPITRFEMRPTDLVVNILTREMAANLPVGKDVLGVAPGAEMKNRNVVYVFAHRVKQLSQMTVRKVSGGGPAWIASESRVLAYAVAHEIGHLLLNSARHPGKGIMRGNWRYSELQALATKNLRFSSDEVKMMHAAVTQRGELTTRGTPRSGTGLNGVAQLLP